MMTPVKGLVLFLMIYFLQAVIGDKHSLLYLYTMQSKNSDSHLYDCTAITLLNDRQIDFYNSSSDKPRTAKQNWLKNISESDWKTSTEKLEYDRQLLNRLLDIQMSEFGHSNSGVHVLQWRHGCEGEQSSDGSLTVLNSINEFGYDGEDLIQFNCTSKTWITPEEKKNREREEEKNREREEEKNREREEEKNREREEKWSKMYPAVKKCDQCEEMLKIFSKYKTTDITQSHTPPAVYMFAKKSVRESRNLTLTCLITGFYPKDVKMSLRGNSTSLPEHLITSSGVRPNNDGTYQLRKSVEIQEDDSADYYRHVSHSSLTEPVIKRWDDFPNEIYVGFFMGVLGVLCALCSVILFVLRMKKCVDQGHLHKVHELTTFSNGGRNRPSHPTSNVQINDTNVDSTEPLLQHKGAEIAGDAEDSAGSHPHEGPVTHPPEGPVTNPPKGAATHPPEGPAISPPEVNFSVF